MSKSVAAAATAPRAKSLARNKNLKKMDKVQPADEAQAVHHDQAPTHLAQAHDASVITVADNSLEGDFSFAQVLSDAQASEASFYTDAGASMGGGVSFLQDDTSGGSGEGSGASTALLVGGGLLAAGALVAVLADGDDDNNGGGSSNRAPVATAGKGSGAEDTVITAKATATDADNNTLTWALKTGTTAAAGVTVAADGTVTLDAKNAAYQSLAAGKTQDVVTNLTVSDGKGGTADTTVTITVTGANDAPTFSAASQAITTDENKAVSGAATATDIDTGDTLSYSVGTGAKNGTAAVGADGKFTYTPNANFDGTDTFTVSVKDAGGLTATQTINVTVKNVGPTTASITVNGAGSNNDADNVDTTYNVQLGTYGYTISGFDVGVGSDGDRIVGPAGVTPTVINSDFADGKIILQYASAGNVAQITLDGLTAAQDAQILGVNGINTVFGAGTIA